MHKLLDNFIKKLFPSIYNYFFNEIKMFRVLVALFAVLAVVFAGTTNSKESLTERDRVLG